MFQTDNHNIFAICWAGKVSATLWTLKQAIKSVVKSFRGSYGQIIVQNSDLWIEVIAIVNKDPKRSAEVELDAYRWVRGSEKKHKF